MAEPNWIQRALNKNKAKAEKYLNDPKQLNKLVTDTEKRARDAEARGGPISAVLSVVGLTTRMVTAWARGEYRSIPWGAMVALVSALIYFIAPIDIIPDMFVGLGLLDDSVILAFVATQLKTELDRFAQWEAAKRVTVDGDRVQTIAVGTAQSGSDASGDFLADSLIAYEDFFDYEVEDAYLDVNEDAGSFEAMAAAIGAEAALHNDDLPAPAELDTKEIEAVDIAIAAPEIEQPVLPPRLDSGEAF